MADFINKNTFQVRVSVNTPDLNTKPDWVELKKDYILPDVNKIYWEWNDDKQLPVEMSQENKDAIDQAILDNVAANEEAMKDINNLEKLTKAFALVTLDQINVLRSKANLTEYTVDQLKQAVKLKYESLS